MKLLVTGGAGFIGSAVIRHLLATTSYSIINVDALTYAGNCSSIPYYPKPRYFFEHIDICNRESLEQVFFRHQPDGVMHLAAESHVDSSINGPAKFMQTNVMGTFNLLDISYAYWSKLSSKRKRSFRFHHISTDEVYGDLKSKDAPFSEYHAYRPNNPYSASKASSDHLVRVWGRTYGMPVLISNCSNNFGPYHHPEKLIPKTILNALHGLPLPIYGSGTQVRDWLFVEDHARALHTVLEKGRLGETYNIGANNERTNIEVVMLICSLLDELVSEKPASVKSFGELIAYVEDRPGHDVRYAVDSNKIQSELGWVAQESFESNLRKTVEWYLNNQDWWQPIFAKPTYSPCI